MPNTLKAGDQTVTQATVSALLNLIKTGALKPGDRLPAEKELLLQIGSSRSALREATSFLKGLGILESRRGSSFWVQHLDPIKAFSQVLDQLSLANAADIGELSLLRITLEIGAVERAVRLATAADIATINNLVDQLEQVGNRPACTVGEYDVLEAEFHCAITRPAGVRLLDILNRAIRDFFRVKNEDLGHGQQPLTRSRHSNLAHRLIAHAFETRQAHTAVLALIYHLSADVSRVPAE